MITESLKKAVQNGEYDTAFRALYGADANLFDVKVRYLSAIDSFEKLYGTALPENAEVRLFSVPGRSEISGNHTDHNHGRVLADAVYLLLFVKN